MVQGYSGHASYNGGLDVVRKVIKSDGIRGLYRGFGLSVITYSPSSAVWWASYGASQRFIWRYCIKPMFDWCYMLGIDLEPVSYCYLVTFLLVNATPLDCKW